MGGRWLATVSVVLLEFMLCAPAAVAADRTGSYIATFGGELPAVAGLHRNVDYQLLPAYERFLIHVPSDYTGREAYGLLVFIYSGDTFQRMPEGWEGALRARKMLFVAPQNAGNGRFDGRRFGMAVFGATAMRRGFNVDADRIYISGFSGGARVAARLAFYQSDLFRGTVQMCGGDFPEEAMRLVVGEEMPYVQMSLRDVDMERAKRNVRFTLITGAGDFRYRDLVTIYQRGLQAGGFQAKLLDVPGMAHDLCSAEVFGRAIAFLDERKVTQAEVAAATTAPVKERTAVKPTTRAAVEAKAPAADPQDERLARRRLVEAKEAVAGRDYAKARERLRLILRFYADTTVASEAKQLLEDIAGK